MTEEISPQKLYVTRSSEGPPSLSNLNALRLTVDAHHRASFQLLPELLKVFGRIQMQESHADQVSQDTTGVTSDTRS